MPRVAANEIRIFVRMNLPSNLAHHPRSAVVMLLISSVDFCDVGKQVSANSAPDAGEDNPERWAVQNFQASAQQDQEIQFIEGETHAVLTLLPGTLWAAILTPFYVIHEESDTPAQM